MPVVRLGSPIRSWVQGRPEPSVPGAALVRYAPHESTVPLPSERIVGNVDIGDGRRRNAERVARRRGRIERDDGVGVLRQTRVHTKRLSRARSCNGTYDRSAGQLDGERWIERLLQLRCQTGDGLRDRRALRKHRDGYGQGSRRRRWIGHGERYRERSRRYGPDYRGDGARRGGSRVVRGQGNLRCRVDGLDGVLRVSAIRREHQLLARLNRVFEACIAGNGG